jgi:hypothetical protein
MRGNGSKMAIVTLVLSIVLGAGTVAATTTALIGWSQARSEAIKTQELDKQFRDWKRDEFAPFKSDYDTLKGQILVELKNLCEGQSDLKTLLREHMAPKR